MAKSNKLRMKANSRGLNKLSSHHKKVYKDAHDEEWENAVCSVCMEFPHNAVLLLCSSYENGCRPYMCATGRRLSNCLEQYKKAYTKVTSKQNTQSRQDDKDFKEESLLLERSEFLCPLCRGHVKGWTVVRPARRFLNLRKRACMQENCSYVGTYKEIKKHVKLEHPLACPRQVDPKHAEKWKELEDERDVGDALSTIRSTMPGSVVIGDYVIENGFSGPAFSSDSLASGYDSVDGGYFRVRGPFVSRSARRGVPRPVRLHARLLFRRRIGRL